MIIKRSLQVLVTSIIIVLAFPNKTGFKYEFTSGSQWKHETLISPIDFPILKTEKELEEDKKQIESKRILYYKKDTQIEDSLYAKLQEVKNIDNKEREKLKEQIKKIYNIGVLQKHEITQSDSPLIIIENNIAKEYEQEELDRQTSAEIALYFDEK